MTPPKETYSKEYNDLVETGKLAQRITIGVILFILAAVCLLFVKFLYDHPVVALCAALALFFAAIAIGKGRK